MNKINICFHIGDISNCGGTEHVTTQISNLLCEHYDNYNIYILSNYFDLKKGPYFKGNDSIKYNSLYNKKIRIRLHPIKTIKKINKFILDNKIDILIGVDTILSLFDIKSIKNTNCKYIAWEHFNYYSNLGIKLRDKGRKISAKKADALVVLTKKDCENFKNNLEIKTKIVQIYNPFTYNDNLNNKYNKNSNIIMSSGRLTTQKGFDMLIEVANKVRKKYSDFKWIILGDGEDKNKLLSKIKEYNLEDHVLLKGRVSNTDDYYKMSKFFILTSRFEGLGIVVLEAKKNNLPVISFDCNCGPSEMIIDNENGYLIKNFDLDVMAEKIVYLLNNNDICDKMSKKSKLNMELFNEIEIVKKWDELFKNLLK